MLLHLPVTVSGCGRDESLPDLSASALFVVATPHSQSLNEARGSEPPTRAKQPGLISREDPAEEGCAGRLGVAGRGLEGPRSQPPSPLRSFRFFELPT
jgi:hypothetical protein